MSQKDSCGVIDGFYDTVLSRVAVESRLEKIQNFQYLLIFYVNSNILVYLWESEFYSNTSFAYVSFFQNNNLRFDIINHSTVLHTISDTIFI